MKFPIQRYEGSVRRQMALRLAARKAARQPSAICAKLGIPSAFPLPHLPSVPYTLREKRYRKNHPGVEAERLQTKGKKISSAMAYKLKDRKRKDALQG